MGNSDLKIRTKDYALSVIRLFAALPKRTETQILGRQLLRSGTSVGAPFYVAARVFALCPYPLPFVNDARMRQAAGIAAS